MVMETIKDMLHEEYVKRGTRPKGAKVSDLKGITPEKIPAPVVIKRKRGLGDVFVALQAQKVYNPNMPSIPSPQPAPANTFQKGVTPALDTGGAWGSPTPQGEK